MSISGVGGGASGAWMPPWATKSQQTGASGSLADMMSLVSAGKNDQPGSANTAGVTAGSASASTSSSTSGFSSGTLGSMLSAQESSQDPAPWSSTGSLHHHRHQVASSHASASPSDASTASASDPLAALFKVLDADGDGSVSKDELASAVSQLRQPPPERENSRLAATRSGSSAVGSAAVSGTDPSQAAAANPFASLAHQLLSAYASVQSIAAPVAMAALI